MNCLETKFQIDDHIFQVIATTAIWKVLGVYPKFYYIALRNRYLPARIKNLFILESPPASGKFFYDPQGSMGEPLFTAMMKVIGINPESTIDGLKRFSDSGNLIVDATYIPVDNIQNDYHRSEIVIKNLPCLIDDIHWLLSEQRRQPKIILVKMNICRMLEKPLKEIGFNIVNHGIKVPFPSNGNQVEFHKAVKRILGGN